MVIYLINKLTNSVVEVFDNVKSWGENFVEFTTNGLRSKIYCDIETEYFTDNHISQEVTDEQST